MTNEADPMCSEAQFQTILAAAEREPQQGVEMIDAAIADHARDARLHFLRGSLLIGLHRFIEAHQALSRAVELAPGFHLARFQLGFFELTSGEGEAARTTWAPLRRALPAEHYLARFVEGLDALISDRLSDCVAALRMGIAANRENPPLNADMVMIIEKCEGVMAQQQTSPDTPEPTEVSATSFLLGAGRR